MINALYLVTFNEGVSPEEKTAMRDEARAACEAVAPAWLCDIVPDDSPTNAGDLFCELAFADRTAYDEAAGSPSWESLREAVSDSSLAADVTFLAYGPGQANLKGGDSTCHRIMLMHLVEGVDPKMVEAMTQRVLQVGEYVPGLVNTQISEVFDSSGAVPWNYVYDCDFDTAATFLGKYMTSPYHWGYLRLLQSDCVECVADKQMTPYIPAERAFLTALD